MSELLLCAALLAAAPASAQVVFDSSGVAREGDGAKSLRELLTPAPAPVDAEPIAQLLERLAHDGVQVETARGMRDLYQRFGRFDARGKARNLQVAVVELKDPADSNDAPTARHAVYRRYFSRLEAKNEDYSLKKDGTGRADIWDWVLSLDGKLMSVTHTVVPITWTEGGAIEPVDGKTRVYRMLPSDPAVQRLWNQVVKELLTLGRTVSL